MITDGPDVGDARDVLERSLAVDRADIPAVTQRRQLAEQDQAVAPARRRERPGRCEIPDWFDPLRDQTRQELAEAKQRVAANAAKRERLETQLEAARAVRDRLEEPTPWERERLVAAQHEADVARRDLAAAEQRLEGCGIRGRRRARRDVAAAEKGLTWANRTLDQARASISPDVERYHQTTQRVRDLSDALHSHETRELLDRYTTTDRIPHLHQRLDALDTWWRFAKGDSIDVDRLGELIDVLGTVAGDHGRYRWLADTVEQYCDDAGIHLPTPEPEAPGIETPGLGIGL